MGRTVVAEKYLESEVKSLVASGAKYGLILGQVRSNSDSGGLPFLSFFLTVIVMFIM